MSRLFPITRFGSAFTADPFDVFSAFDGLFDTHFPTSRSKKIESVKTIPRANIVKNNKGFTVELASPGLSREDFELNVENGLLSVHVGMEDGPEYNEKIVSREWKYNSFTRSWSLPEGTSVKGIQARYEAGILYIDVPVEGKDDSVINILVE